MIRKIMSMQKWIAFLIVLSPLCLFADSFQSKGIELTKKFWKDAQANNVNLVANYTSSSFQALEGGTIITREQFLNKTEHVVISSYSFSHFNVLKSKSLLIVTYDLNLIETFDHSSINNTAQRMTVWQKIGPHWKLIAHVSLAPPNKNPTSP